METTEQTINKIITFANNNDSIRVVVHNGSRVNPNIKPDKYSDYDIIFATSSINRFIEDQSWISYFGKLLILQLNICKENEVECPIFLMQFEDGLRIDLSFYPIDKIENKLSDSLTKIILDKDNKITSFIEPSDLSYITKKPNEKDYYETVNEFWWCIINVAKGISRKELCYSKYMYESIVRECFLKIISWYLSSKNNWEINTGKYGKFIQNHCSSDLWNKIKLTYSDYKDSNFWFSIYLCCEIIIEIESELSMELNYTKYSEKGNQIIDFLKKIEDDKLKLVSTLL